MGIPGKQKRKQRGSDRSDVAACLQWFYGLGCTECSVQWSSPTRTFCLQQHLFQLQDGCSIVDLLSSERPSFCVRVLLQLWKFMLQGNRVGPHQQSTLSAGTIDENPHGEYRNLPAVVLEYECCFNQSRLRQQLNKGPASLYVFTQTFC